MLADPDKTIRSFLRSRASLSAFIDDRVYFAVPEQDRPTLPFILMYQVGGTVDYAQVSRCEYIFECWARNKFEASNLSRLLIDELLLIDDGTPVTVEGVRIVGSRINQGSLPVEGTSWAKRYRVDTSWWLRAV